ncbi:hypothetical protein [Devosia sp. RR2S18]|uniref:hypothetical protein n=1 Tax=Devosia rhizosphaerae TaxID=3049774 RepID=UPI0025406A45|nr:hypothetical protein [Devosia sp. RR2S18]WIJ23932.1 hypothetical protein QOV41_12885 [Devosia sp. RR2S18]
MQTGKQVTSSIVQIGDGHERVHVQMQDYSAMGSVQVDALHSGMTRDGSSGGTGGVHLHFGLK